MQIFPNLLTYVFEHSVGAVPLFRRLVAGLSPRRPELNPRSVCLGFMVEKVALGQVFFRVIRSFRVIVIQPMPHIPLTIWRQNFLLNFSTPVFKM